MIDELIKYETMIMATNNGFIGTPNEHGYVIPTQSLLQRWLREIHEIFISVRRNSQSKFQFSILLNKNLDVEIDEGIVSYYKNVNMLNMEIFDTYENALETALQDAIKIIPQL